MSKPSKSYRELALGYIRDVQAATGRTPSDLAKIAGVASTTFTRPLNNPDFRYAPKVEALRALSAGVGIPLPAELGEPAPVNPEGRTLAALESIAVSLARIADALEKRNI